MLRAANGATLVQQVRVRPYVRKDGTAVRGHTRRGPSGKTAGGGILALIIAAGIIWWLFGHHSAGSPDTKPSQQWSSGGLTFVRADSSDSDSCHPIAYGQVRDFLSEHPCTSLTRALFDATDGQGHRMLVAVSWTEMPDTGQAAALRDLADHPDTGNLTELTRDGVKFSGRHYASATSGSTTVIAEAEPVAGSPSAELLRSAAAAALQATRP